MAGDPVRDEAERLVSAAITAVSVAARSIPRTGGRPLATGSPECCVCPVCRVIASMRDPSAEMTERLAQGAGELATAVASVLRTLSRGGSETEPDTREGDEFWESLRRRAQDAAAPPSSSSDDDPWRAATTAPPTKPMAKKATKKAAGASAGAGSEAPVKPVKKAGSEAPVKKTAKKATKKATPPKATGG